MIAQFVERLEGYSGNLLLSSVVVLLVAVITIMVRSFGLYKLFTTTFAGDNGGIGCGFWGGCGRSATILFSQKTI
jgi:hypothetical protein